MIHLNPTGAYGLGVRLERNGFQTVLIDFDGNILSRFTNAMELPPPEQTLEIVCSDINAALATMCRPNPFPASPELAWTHRITLAVG